MCKKAIELLEKSITEKSGQRKFSDEDFFIESGEKPTEGLDDIKHDDPILNWYEYLDTIVRMT